MTIAGTGMTEYKSTKNGKGFMMRSPLTTTEQTPRAMAAVAMRVKTGIKFFPGVVIRGLKIPLILHVTG